MTGKGSKPRPFDRARFDANFDGIQWKKKPPCQHDYVNAVRRGRLDYRCPDCGADVTFGVVMLKEAEGWK